MEIQRIERLTIWTRSLPAMKAFYQDALGLPLVEDGEEDGFAEFAVLPLHLLLCDYALLEALTGALPERANAPSFQLAFPLGSPEAVDRTYRRLLEHHGRGVAAPKNRPWGQRTALFADPEGNIHALTAPLHCPGD